MERKIFFIIKFQFVIITFNHYEQGNDIFCRYFFEIWADFWCPTFCCAFSQCPTLTYCFYYAWNEFCQKIQVSDLCPTFGSSCPAFELAHFSSFMSYFSHLINFSLMKVLTDFIPLRAGVSRTSDSPPRKSPK